MSSPGPHISTRVLSNPLPTPLRFSSPGQRASRSWVLLAIAKEKGRCLQFAAPNIQDDKVTVLAAVTSDGTALEFASPRLRTDFEVVMQAVRQNSNAIQYVPDDLKQKGLLEALLGRDKPSAANATN